MSDSFNAGDSRMVLKLAEVIKENRDYLSTIDGKIGDGDHGINMNKGFQLCRQQLEDGSYSLKESIEILSNILMTKIGGSMGPIYGMFFSGLVEGLGEKSEITAEVYLKMLKAGLSNLQDISDAEPGDKTLMDALVPAVDAFEASVASNESFSTALIKMGEAADAGSKSTEDMVAKIGRSSRLGERSRGVIDAGSASCALILNSMADIIIENL
ncbi:MAG: dihydroxyacetone kinase subunit DhaL [Spirochaetales bacterium]|uniref:Dihydroxyacetone kinase subunit DhaL n=1 Tax=Candidatus Thalassospirochaeta sargassi TaxID=3119039 RepID=A0AAJ1ID61_9SPIO|nr:dihydroxyacetone kinase subunit DhaL [Spirochaetales bacterium]